MMRSQSTTEFNLLKMKKWELERKKKQHQQLVKRAKPTISNESLMLRNSQNYEYYIKQVIH